jgi:hypothetical protein
VANQLIVFQKFIGTEGSGASNVNQRHTFAIVYGILVEFGEQEPKDWIDLDDFSDTDEAACAPYDENDELINDAVPAWAPKDTRRNQTLRPGSRMRIKPASGSRVPALDVGPKK